MKKHLGIIAALLFVSSTAMLWAGWGQNSNRGYSSGQAYQQQICVPQCLPSCPQTCPACPSACDPCRPVCEPCVPSCCPPPSTCPICPPQVCKKANPCKCGPSGRCCINGVTVIARNPNQCMLGDQYPLEFDIRACEDVCDVVISTVLPEGVTFMRSCPEARVEGRKVIWDIGHMSKGQCIAAKVWLKCEREGELCACFCVDAKPVAFCSLLCAKPVLCCEKCGPKEACPGEAVNYVVTVTNVGSCTAEGVVLTDNVPEGLQHASGQRTLCYNLGCLEPCQSKRVNICFTACKRGKVCNVANVSACNANPTSCEACTLITMCDVECCKTGPKEIMIGQNATYQIVVTNTGDKALTDVVVCDTAPSCTAIVAAEGACIRGNNAVWRLRQLCPGERATFNITLTTCTPGFFVNRAAVNTCQGCRGCCEFGTAWKGRPALTACLYGSDNSVCVGDTVRYTLCVENQGQEMDSNVRVVVRFPNGMQPISATGATCGKIQGQTVVYEACGNLPPRQTAQYVIEARAKSPGDARIRAEVSSDAIQSPLTQEISTIVN